MPKLFRARYLSARLAMTISLPTEWQWQQAACSGRADFNYPWGKDYQSGYANINETWEGVGSHKLGRTSAVGIYPPGDSKQGVSDLSGNVWEWCLNSYEHPEQSQSAGTFSRVPRGGSWFNGPDDAGALCRYGLDPGNRYNSIGFRLCLSPI